MSKICTVCGQPTQSVTCPNCGMDHGDKFASLPDFGEVPPARITYGRNNYANWVERMEQYKPLIYPELENARTFVDIGCGPNKLVSDLKADFPALKGTGLDMYPLAEDVLKIDFENDPLPFAEDEIDVMLLSHVLEHLEKLHFVLENAIKASRKVIIALPNYCTMTMLGRFRAGEFRGLYGLPLVAPMDRHRWIYMLPEMDRLIAYYAFRFGLSYKAHYFLHRRTPPIVGRLFRRKFVYEAIYVMEKR